MKKIKRDKIVGAGKISNYLLLIIMLGGGISFFIVGFLSYFKAFEHIALFSRFVNSDIRFIPQGITMIFYGTMAICLSIYIYFSIYYDIGAGYNEFNLISKKVVVFRKGFPGKNRLIKFVLPIPHLKSVKVMARGGINPKYEVFLYTKNLSRIPIGQVFKLSKLEYQASEIATFLGLAFEQYNL
uniref:Photosystem I assembly protein Ycf4 n=1 Tax=Cyanidium caldarium TaxID=2771 RepID=YCF4_CYACA|nr:photosystem I assembly protein Ycf4 [Cyanidium caldarium]Q9TM19.1 RecName: Full=Photosystem I assembly protein Ycf4 [Cyanidium caldarium]AAF12998.1 unknown [Cyanidium caldarium]